MVLGRVCWRSCSSRCARSSGLRCSFQRPRIRLRFDRITQPWLRELAKRWARLRLGSGLTVATVQSDVAALTRFSAMAAKHQSTVAKMAAKYRFV